MSDPTPRQRLGWWLRHYFGPDVEAAGHPDPMTEDDWYAMADAALAALSTTPAPDPSANPTELSGGLAPLDAAWAAAEAALAPTQRLVMWQDRGGPRFVQVLAPDPTITDDDGEPVDDVMAPVISILADYPSKGLGKGVVVELLALAEKLRESQP